LAAHPAALHSLRHLQNRQHPLQAHCNLLLGMVLSVQLIPAAAASPSSAKPS